MGCSYPPVSPVSVDVFLTSCKLGPSILAVTVPSMSTWSPSGPSLCRDFILKGQSPPDLPVLPKSLPEETPQTETEQGTKADQDMEE